MMRLKTRVKITDAMIDAGLDAFLAHGVDAGCYPPGVTRGDFHDISIAREGLRKALRAASESCRKRAGA